MFPKCRTIPFSGCQVFAHAMIQVQSFCKAYESAVAVEQLTFRVAPGEILGLIGPNGAGKTTTMRALAGIIPFSSGTLSVAGYDVVRQPVQVKQCTAYVADDPQLFNDLTVGQHLAFVASVYGVGDWQTEMGELLQQFELATRVDCRASDLSRGMRQKLALACAYLYRPAALLLDEPMTGLDPQGIRMLKQSLKVRAAAGSAVIISSHLLAMVEDICSHVLILKSGRQTFYGTIGQLRDRFADDQQQSSLEDIFFLAVEGDVSFQPGVADPGWTVAYPVNH